VLHCHNHKGAPLKSLAFLVLATFLSVPGFAEKLGSNHQVGQDKQSGPKGKRRGPPPEALAACKGKSSGTECSFQSPHGDNVSGTCFAPKTDLPLGCRPSHPPNGGGKGDSEGGSGH
jgi:hypothetical protein